MDSFNIIMKDFFREYCDYLPEDVPILPDFPPKPMDFFLDYMNSSLPFVTRQIDDNPPFKAPKNWKDKSYLREQMSRSPVTVSVSPVGQSDEIVNDLFMVPEESEMLYRDFISLLRNSKSPYSICLKKQSNNLRREFFLCSEGKSLDLPTELSFANDALANPPVAANIAVEDHRTYTPMRRDKYEKFFFMIEGVKIFDLYPPVATYWMPYKKYKKFQWFLGEKKWEKKDLNEEISWIPKERKPDTREKFMLYANTKSYQVTLNPGQLFYIPALWYYEIHQKDYSVSADYWYDMKYDSKYPFFSLYEKLCQIPQPRKDAVVEGQPELQESLRLDLTKAYLMKHKIVVPLPKWK